MNLGTLSLLLCFGITLVWGDVDEDKERFSHETTRVGMSFLSLFENKDMFFCNQQTTKMASISKELKSNCTVFSLHQAECESAFDDLISSTSTSICPSASANSVFQEKWMAAYSGVFLENAVIQKDFYIDCNTESSAILGGQSGAADLPLSSMLQVQQYYSLVGEPNISNFHDIQVNLYLAPGDCLLHSKSATGDWPIDSLTFKGLSFTPYQPPGQNSSESKPKFICKSPCDSNPIQNIASLLDPSNAEFNVTGVDFELELVQENFLVTFASSKE